MTNLAAIKLTVKALFDCLELTPIPECPIIVNHLVTDNMINPVKIDDKLELVNLLENNKMLNIWRDQWFERFDNAESVNDIMMYIRKPYKLTFLKYAKNDIDIKEFSKLFAEAWILSENPNQDANCSIPLLIKWFKQCDKSYLMTPDDKQIYDNLPSTVTVYRGVATNHISNGLSWTRNLETAKWFANRFNHDDKKGYVQCVTIPKEKVLAYFNTRNEDEIIVDTMNLKNITIIE